MTEKDTARVNMNWPAALKERVTEAVGQRGLTTFAVAAVEEKLSSIDAQKRLEGEVEGLRKEIDETRYLAQLLADRFVMSDDRRSALMEVDLPSWLETNGWPDELAALVPKVDPEIAAAYDVPPDQIDQIDPEAVDLVTPSTGVEEPVEDEDLHRPMFMTGRAEPDQPQGEPDPAVGITDEERQALELPHDTQGDDLLERIRAKAAEKGLDIDQARLKPASQIPTPQRDKEADSPTDNPEPEIESPQVSEPQESTPVDTPVDKDLCPKCGDELVAGECWSC